MLANVYSLTCPPQPFVSSEVETPIVRARLMGLSTSLETNGFTGCCGLKRVRE